MRIFQNTNYDTVYETDTMNPRISKDIKYTHEHTHTHTHTHSGIAFKYSNRKGGVHTSKHIH